VTDGSQVGGSVTEIVVDAGGGGYGFLVDERNRLRQTGFSPAVAAHVAALDRGVPAGPYPLAYPAYDEEPHGVPALRVTHATGVTSTRLRFAGHDRTQGPMHEEHRIDLVDETEPLGITLAFRAWADHGVLEQWVEIENRQAGPVALHEVASAAPLLIAPHARLTHFPGDWATEWSTCEESLTPGTKVVESRGGVRPHLFLAPFVLLAPEGEVTEDEGLVLAGALAWGGDVRFSFGRDLGGRIRVWCGHNPASGPYVLDPGERFVAPRAVWAWSTGGRGPLSRRLHTWVREHVVRDGDRRRAVVANNWETTYFDFDEPRVLALMDGAREVGAELFLLDDGWFGSPEHPRDADDAGLGDWQVDRRKLPGGLEGLTEGARARGLRFGLWVEPEMVNPRSHLFAAHPDWVVGQPGRTGRKHRQQLVLDLCRPEVREFVVATVDRLLTEHPGISYLKWDANRPITEPGSGALPADRQSSLWVAWTRGMGEVMSEVVLRHPDVEMMLCASGGGRVDFGTLRWFHEVWLSDNTDPVTRLRMQWAASQFLPALVMAGHVTRWGDRPLPFACAVAMSVRFGFDLDTTALSPAELAVCRRAAATYGRVADLVQHGDLHRLVAPVAGPGERAALAYVAPDGRRAVVFGYQVEDLPAGAPADPLRLAALDPELVYGVRAVDLGVAAHAGGDEPADDLGDGTTGGLVDRRGSDLAADGLVWPLTHALTATVWELAARPR
jgi:alpha-galactosidase